jgi:hypothetical protein
MNEWKKHFADKIGKLRSHWEESFEGYANETLQSVFEEFADFVSRYEFQASSPNRQSGLRSFKFALGEDVFVLLTFKPARMGEFEMQSEFFVPGQGLMKGHHQSVGAESADRDWAEGCFQNSLDHLVTQVADSSGVQQDRPEPAMA